MRPTTCVGGVGCGRMSHHKICHQNGTPNKPGTPLLVIHLRTQKWLCDVYLSSPYTSKGDILRNMVIAMRERIATITFTNWVWFFETLVYFQLNWAKNHITGQKFKNFMVSLDIFMPVWYSPGGSTLQGTQILLSFPPYLYLATSEIWCWSGGREYQENCLCATVLCTIIMVHKGTSSSYLTVSNFHVAG